MLYKYTFDNVLKKLFLRSAALLFIGGIFSFYFIHSLVETQSDLIIVILYSLIFFTLSILGIIETFHYYVMIDDDHIYVRHFFRVKKIRIDEITNVSFIKNVCLSNYKIHTRSGKISLYAVDNISEILVLNGVELSTIEQ